MPFHLFGYVFNIARHCVSVMRSPSNESDQQSCAESNAECLPFSLPLSIIEYEYVWCYKSEHMRKWPNRIITVLGVILVFNEARCVLRSPFGCAESQMNALRSMQCHTTVRASCTSNGWAWCDWNGWKLFLCQSTGLLYMVLLDVLCGKYQPNK